MVELLLQGSTSIDGPPWSTPTPPVRVERLFVLALVFDVGAAGGRCLTIVTAGERTTVRMPDFALTESFRE